MSQGKVAAGTGRAQRPPLLLSSPRAAGAKLLGVNNLQACGVFAGGSEGLWLSGDTALGASRAQAFCFGFSHSFQLFISAQTYFFVCFFLSPVQTPERWLQCPSTGPRVMRCPVPAQGLEAEQNPHVRKPLFTASPSKGQSRGHILPRSTPGIATGPLFPCLLVSGARWCGLLGKAGQLAEPPAPPGTPQQAASSWWGWGGTGHALCPSPCPVPIPMPHVP